MKRILSLLIFVTSVLSLEAVTVKGRVIDENKMPFGFVNVILRGTEADNSGPYGSATDDNGYFSVSDVPAGEYTLEISFIGYQTITKKITIAAAQSVYTAGTFTLREDSQMLDAVEVVGQASQMRFEIDKKVFDVDQNLAAAGEGVSDVLENIPSVEVDNDGNISLRNNSNVEVWINGKPSGLNEDNRAQILEQMPAGTIESIELITNPSAKFDAEGSAGIINLVLKKERQAGYFGSVNASVNYPVGSLPGTRVGANFNYNSSKIDAYANIGFRYRNNTSKRYTDRYSFTPGSNPQDTTSFLSNDDLGNRRNLGVFFRGGFDWYITKKHSLGMSFMANFGDNYSNTTNNYTRVDWPLAAGMPFDTTVYRKTNIQDGDRPSISATLDYLWDINDRSDWRTSLEFSWNRRYNDYYYEQIADRGDVSEYEQHQYSDGARQSLRFKSDYTLKVLESMRLEAGVAASWQNRMSPSRTWNVADDGSEELEQYNDFDYNEWIAAAYATYGGTFGRFSFSAGLRAEYTDISISTRDAETLPYDITRKSYFQVFPTAFLSYSLPAGNELQVNYTRRINRPRGWQINAFRDVSDSTNISFGNPYLDPEYADAAEFNYIKTWEEHALSASLYYRHMSNMVRRVSYLGADDVMYSTFENISDGHSAGLEIVAKNKVTKWLNLTTTLNGYYSYLGDVYYDTNLDGTEDLLSPAQNTFSFSARIMANFIMPLGFSGQLTGFYHSPDVVAQGRTKAHYAVDLGLRKSFLKKSLNLNLTIRDIFNTRCWRQTTWGDNFWQYSEFASRGTYFQLSASYSFGNLSFDKRRTHEPVGGEGGSDVGF